MNGIELLGVGYGLAALLYGGYLLHLLRRRRELTAAVEQGADDRVG
jgi:hypothetical protein